MSGHPLKPATPPTPRSRKSEPDTPHDGDGTWVSWLTSVASSAYDSVVGAPESYRNLTPTTALRQGEDAEVSSEFGEVGHEERQALWKQLASTIGMDVMHLRLSLPIWIFEPTTALVRMAEIFEFADLLDRAATDDDPVHRDCLVAAFVISAFSHTGRVRKPFNPMLGETFEFESPVNGMRFYAEQVSHHPPLSVSRCEGEGWVSGELVDVNATFWGNALEITNVGTRYIHLTKTNDQYTWTLPKVLVSNLFIGGAFVDHYGTIELKNETTGTLSTLVLTKCGWFSSGRHEVNGALTSKDGDEVLAYKGAWNKNLDCERPKRRVGEGTNRLWMAGSHMLPENEGGGARGTLANCTKFTKELLTFDEEAAEMLPITDSRLRPDRLALERGLKTKASDEKLRIEQAQRNREKKRLEKGMKYTPRWFKKSPDGKNWEPTGDYWKKAHYKSANNTITPLW